MLFFDRGEWNIDHNPFLWWQNQFVLDMSLSLSNRDAPKYCPSNVLVIGDQMTPELYIVAERLIAEEDKQSVQILHILA